jgi:hypothetical protein
MEEFTELETDFERAQYLQNLLINHATGGFGDQTHYAALREYFLTNPQTKQLTPRWIRTNRDLSQFWQFIKFEFRSYAERRQFIWSGFEPLLQFLETRQRLPAEEAISGTLQRFDADGVHFAWSKALERQAADPEGAITSARTMLESVCKHILDDLAIGYSEKSADIGDLYKLTSRALSLSPDQHSEEVFKQILGGCASVVNGLGSLRNRLGDAHGKGRSTPKPAPRHAELAVNLAGAVALFLIETYEARRTLSSRADG